MDANGTDVVKSIISNHLRATSSVTLRRAQRAAEEIIRRYGPIKLTPQQRQAEIRQRRVEHERNRRAEALRRKRQKIQDAQYERNRRREKAATERKEAHQAALRVAQENAAVSKVRLAVQPLGRTRASSVLQAVMALVFEPRIGK